MAKIACKLDVHCSQIRNVVVWGNHSWTQFPDVRHATVNGKSVREKINDDNFIEDELIEKIRNRADEILKMRNTDSGFSAAIAMKDHLKDWWCGRSGNEFTSMGVVSGGQYGLKEGLVFSLPC